MVPVATLIGYLVNPTSPLGELEKRDAETAARILGVRLIAVNASTLGEIEAAFEILLGQRIEALLVGGDPLFNQLSAQLTGLAARHAVPAIYHIRQIVDAGGLMSYGSDIADAERIGGNYVGRILKGEKPTDLPVQQSTRVEMALNLKTAKALGINVPPAILLRADEVIE
jgi:putative ABC transport system substrate-binding protein